MLQGLALAVFAVYGALMGSFANVAIWRIPRGESIVTPGSHCPHCAAPIRWYDNIPILSWLFLRATCRDCGTPISLRYPVIEGLSAFLWFGAAVAFGTGLLGLVAALLFWTLMVLAFIDLDTMRLPNVIVAPLALFGYLAAVVSQLTGIRIAPLTGVAESGILSAPLLSAAIGSLAGAGISLAIAGAYAGVRGRSGFGMGDVKLLAALGPFVGPYTLMVLVLGSIAGATIGIVSAARTGEGLSAAKIPFGPYLALGAVVVAFGGPAMWGWYASLVGLT